MNKNKKGKPFVFPNSFILVIGYIRTSFHLPYRQTEGIIKATGKRLPANPSYGHICKRIDKLTIDTKKDEIDNDDDDLIELSKSYVGKEELNAFETKFEKLKKTKARSHTGRDRTYKDLLKGRFRLTKVIRFEPKSYDNSISGKGSDFTSVTIKNLIEKGEMMRKRFLNK